MLDTSVLIDAERGRLDIEGRIEQAADEAIVISAITASELLHGVHRARTAAQRIRREHFVDRVLREIPTAEFGLAEAHVHARIWAQLLERGQVIGAHDLVIAATVIAIGFRLATTNPREFRRVPDLSVEVWTDAPA
jgi:tRNA(fMet)-specific endonuclease VapC